MHIYLLTSARKLKSEYRVRAQGCPHSATIIALTAVTPMNKEVAAVSEGMRAKSDII